MVNMGYKIMEEKMEQTAEKSVEQSKTLILETARQLLYDLYQLPVLKLDRSEQREEFCRSYRLHEQQALLESTTLETVLDRLSPDIIACLSDVFQIQFVLFVMDGVPFSIGPFCSLLFTERDARRILDQCGITTLTPTTLLAYQSQFPVLEMKKVLKIASSVIQLIHPEDHHRTVEDFSRYAKSKPDVWSEFSEEVMRENYYNLIQERYRIEQRFMENVEKGNSHAAVLNLQNMQQDVAFLKRMGTTLENERIGSAIVRTVVRMAAFRAGLPAATIDLLSSNYTKATRQARTVEEIHALKEEMVRAFCREVHHYKDNHYSSLILSAVYYIEHQLSQNLSVKEIAKELHVSVNHLILCFRKEMGMTPVAYIRKARMKQAASLLTGTELTVQQVSSLVGIEDANYFVKLFKREYQKTPTQYRKYHQL